MRLSLTTLAILIRSNSNNPNHASMPQVHKGLLKANPVRRRPCDFICVSLIHFWTIIRAGCRKNSTLPNRHFDAKRHGDTVMSTHFALSLFFQQSLIP